MEGHLKSMKREGVKNEALISPKTSLVSARFTFRFTVPLAGWRCLPGSGSPAFKDSSLPPPKKFLSKKEFESHKLRSTSKRARERSGIKKDCFSRRRFSVSTAWAGIDRITNAAHSVNQGRVADFFAQSSDKNFYELRVVFMLVFPNGFAEFGAGKNAARFAQECL